MLILTDRVAVRRQGRSLVEVVEALSEVDGLGLVFREKDLDPEPRRNLAKAVAAAATMPLFVASDAELARQVGAIGVHFDATEQRPRTEDLIAGCSVHNAREIHDAQRTGMDYLMVSPVYESSTKPGHLPPLDAREFAALVAGSDRPVFGLSGIKPGYAAAVVDAGAHGVAVMGAVMSATDPSDVAQGLVDEVATT